MRFVQLLVLSAMFLTAGVSSASELVVPPFDVSAVSGSSVLPGNAGELLARVVSNEIDRSGFLSERPLVVRGSLVQASVSSVGGRGRGFAVGKQTAEVLLAIRLIDPETGEILAAFDANGTASETGASVDFITALVSFERHDDDWRNSPMGLAIHRAVVRVAEEAALWSQESQ